jgi:hypothetical protein
LEGLKEFLSYGEADSKKLIAESVNLAKAAIVEFGKEGTVDGLKLMCE